MIPSASPAKCFRWDSAESKPLVGDPDHDPGGVVLARLVHPCKHGPVEGVHGRDDDPDSE